MARDVLFVFAGLRFRLGSSLYRVADLSIFRDREPTEDVPFTPPFVVVEIVAPDDRFT